MLILFLLIVTLVLATFHWYYKRRRLPPGPPAVPLLGSLPFLDLRRGLTDWTLDPRVTKHRLATVSVGPKNLFIINDFKLAKELFEKEEFSGRNSNVEWVEMFWVISGKIRGVAFNQGCNWDKQRKFGLKTLKELGFGRQTIEEIVDREISEITNKLGSYSGQNYLIGQEFNIPVINVLWHLVAGFRFDENQALHKSITSGIELQFKSYASLLLLPLNIQRVFRKAMFKKNLRAARNNTKYIRDQIEEHRATLDRENPRDFIDVYLTAMEDDEGLNTDDLTMSLIDFLLAGTETPAVTMKWVVLFLTLHQEVQDRCREEIREVLGDNRCRLEDIQRLPYTQVSENLQELENYQRYLLQSTVSEVQRHAALGPLAIPHQNLTSVKVEGFSFPPTSRFLSNLHFIMRDPRHFQDPELFNPDRFIGEDGRYKKNPALVPFGIGKRQCMGEALARNELMLFTVGLIQRLTFLPPDSGAMPDPQNYHASASRIPADFHVKIDRIIEK